VRFADEKFAFSVKAFEKSAEERFALVKFEAIIFALEKSANERFDFVKSILDKSENLELYL
jgi:hypothetical protein